MDRSSPTQLGHDQEHSTGELVTAALGAGLFGGSGVVAVYGVGCLLACAIIAISGVVAAWPEQAVAGVKADIGEIKEKERAYR